MAISVSGEFYKALATLVLIAHVLFIVWVVLGALLTRSRPVLRILHISSLIWGVLTELWIPCPLTLLENWLEQKAGIEPYHGGFVVHYLDKLVYPDLPANVLTAAAVTVCVFNLGYYAMSTWSRHHIA
jgi:hypothetical protein